MEELLEERDFAFCLEDVKNFEIEIESSLGDFFIKTTTPIKKQIRN